MSASDSDTSIDWLATDNEDEPDCAGGCGRTPAPLSPVLSHGSGETKVDGGVAVDSSQRCVSGRVRTGDSVSGGCCQVQRGEDVSARVAHGALKRPREDPLEQPLAASVSEEGQTFTSKCYELQCYIQPLSSILNGLRSGRYRGRLSSFQESVAMDRIQRIMGVLQNPHLGEKYVHIIQKMEEMLKSWFPNVKPRDQLVVAQTEEAAPTKIQKLSHVSTALAEATASPITTGAPPVGVKAQRVTDLLSPGAYSASSLKGLHTSPICSSTAEQDQAGPSPLLPPRELMQDNAVSSSTDNHSATDSMLKGPPPLGRINAPCLEQLLKSTESIITLKGAVKSSSRS